MKFCKEMLAVILVSCTAPAIAWAGGGTTAVEETVEFLARKFGPEAVQEGSVSLTRRLEVLAARHGDDVLNVARRVGLVGLRALEKAGPRGDEVLKLLVRYGDQGVWIAAKPGRLALFLRFGDEAAEALARHGPAAEQVIGQAGQAGARAVQCLTGENARRLAMMLEEGAVARPGEWLPVIQRYGDSAMEFIWRNKGALATGTILATFLANPKPFLDGAQHLAGSVVSTTGDVVGKTTQAIAAHVNWTVIVSVLAGLVTLYLGWRVTGRWWPRKA